MAISNANQQLALVISSNSTTSYEELLESQKELISKQIYELQNIVSKQCKLTGVNPLSQEMAAGALSIKIGKRPRDLLNPKAIKYMQSIFSVKDEINKKEIRAISALFGLTATQVRDFFNGQRSRVRKFIRISREKAIQFESSEEKEGSANVVPLNSVGPSSSMEAAASCCMQDDTTDESDKYFVGNVFSLLRKEETFSGQVKLMEWILEIQNASVLYWFLTNGGVMILVSWLSAAAMDEQTSVVHVILQVLCHLPLHRALPAHMSAILQSVNKLRFYRGSDVSNRAKSLVSKWSKMFARSNAMRRPPPPNISSVDAMLLKQSIGEIMENESLESRIDNIHPHAVALQEKSRIKLLTGGGSDDSKLLRGGGVSQRERRKVQLVEQPGQVTRILSSSSSYSSNNNNNKSNQGGGGGRPLSADDIQKAKMRAHFMNAKYGSSRVLEKTTPTKLPVPKAAPKVEGEGEGCVVKKKKKGISWVIPPELKMNKEWSVCYGENSKEIDVQNNRIRREKEVFYNTLVEIPPNPKEPWDREMDYDDSLTPEIPTEQLPDDDDMVIETENSVTNNNNNNNNEASSSRNMLGPDLELLAVLLKNPQIVFALTAGQGGSLTNEQMVKLLDAIKAHGGSIDSLVNGLVDDTKAVPKVEVSLPSPTPSSNPPVTTSGWRQESGKNHFSRQSVTVNGDAYTIPGVHSHYQRVVRPDRRTQEAAHFRNTLPYLLPEHGPHMGREQPNPYSHTTTNYNVFGTPSWVRYGDGPGFESWSPNNSPSRSYEYSEPPRHNYMNNPSRGGSSSSSWWRDRRR